MPKLNKDKATQLIHEKLIKSGCSHKNLEGITEGILDAEYSGIKSHGFHYLPIYCNHLKIGKINGNSMPFSDTTGSIIKINADNGFAHSAINLGIPKLINLANDQGIACMSIYNSYNCGVLGYHTKKIAMQGILALGFTNAPASIAPVGATKAVIGTNPFSLSVPYKGGIKILIDQSSSVIAKSEISVRAKKNEPIPEGWAFDSDGKPTTDANEALKGTMAPTGGYKGFGVGMLVEILTACIAGGNLGIHASSFAGEDGGPPSTGQFFIAINPKKFNPNYETAVEDLVDAIVKQDGARLPGSKRLSHYQANLDQDILINDDLFDRLQKI